MAGIYIHIPFCKKACHYCNFHFSTSLHRKKEFLQALHHEIGRVDLFHTYLNEQILETLYFGGGTPSILDVQELDELFSLLNRKFRFSNNAEITLEANPDDIDATKLADWKALGINRLSIGTQSFFEEDLRWMNRAHNDRQALNAISLAGKAGFNNLNIDLIYGTPTLTDERWLANLQKAKSLGINHLSCYALTVEEKTALDHFVKRGKIIPPTEQQQARHFELLQQWAADESWDHYEISNLCLPGHRSRHNTNYWLGKPYAGFGPSAHSFNGFDVRMMAVSNNAQYIAYWLEHRGVPYEREILTDTDRLNEKVMTGLRLKEGIELSEKERKIADIPLGEKQWYQLQRTIKKWEEKGLMEYRANRISLTPHGRLFADAIASEMFI